MSKIIPAEMIENRIFFIRGQKVMIDRDLAELYQVKTMVLNQAVKRNQERFPEGFMFQLSKREKKELITNCDRFNRLKHSPYLPYAFTEQGVAMLSSVLRSKRAIRVNILVMQTFVRLRNIASSYKGVLGKLEKLEEKYDTQFKVVFDALRKILVPKEKKQKRMGFLADRN